MSTLWSKGTQATDLVEDFTVGNDRILDMRLAKYDVIGSKAHIKMLESIGLLTAEELETLTDALDQILGEINAGEFVIEDDVEDIHSQVELLLTRRLGDIGKKIHSGRSRNDQVLVDVKLFLKDEVLTLRNEVLQLFYTLQNLSEEYKNVLLPGYTHGQVAMPSSFGLWFLSAMTSRATPRRLVWMVLLRGGMSWLISRFRLGLPMAIKFASVMTSKLFVNAFVNSYGVAVSAFSGIAHKIGTITNMLSNSFNTAGSSMVGQNIGAGCYDRVGKVMRSIFTITVSIDTLLSLLMILFPAQIIGLFTSDPEVISIGLKYVPIAVVMFYGSAARSGMNALINGSGNYKVNFATAILDGIVMRIGLALLFGLALGMKAYGFWLGDALAGFTPFFIGIVFYYSGKWKKSSV